MFIPLTSQEKKVLGFISLLFILGSLVLLARHFTQVPAPRSSADTLIKKQ